jgi:hypothetical protein
MTGAIMRGGYRGQTATDSAVSGPASGAGETSVEKTASDEQSGLAGSAETGVAGPAEAAGDVMAPDSNYSGGSAGQSSAGAGSVGSVGSTGTAAGLPSTQMVIKTADYRIEIAPGEFDDKYSQLAAIAAKYGGYVVSGDTRSGEDQLKHGTVTIRVASANDGFGKAQAEIDSLGNVTSRKISGDDVSEEYVDLQSRLRNAQAQEAQMLELMKKAATIEEILTVQARLADIQAEIEQIKGRLQYMDTRIQYATITVDLRETGGEGSDGGSGQDIEWGFVESLRYAGWLAVQSVNFVIVSLGIIIPVLVIGLGLFLLGRLVVKRMRER